MKSSRLNYRPFFRSSVFNLQRRNFSTRSLILTSKFIKPLIFSTITGSVILYNYSRIPLLTEIITEGPNINHRKCDMCGKVEDTIYQCKDGSENLELCDSCRKKKEHRQHHFQAVPAQDWKRQGPHGADPDHITYDQQEHKEENPKKKGIALNAPGEEDYDRKLSKERRKSQEKKTKKGQKKIDQQDQKEGKNNIMKKMKEDPTSSKPNLDKVSRKEDTGGYRAERLRDKEVNKNEDENDSTRSNRSWDKSAKNSAAGGNRVERSDSSPNLKSSGLDTNNMKPSGAANKRSLSNLFGFAEYTPEDLEMLGNNKKPELLRKEDREQSQYKQKKQDEELKQNDNSNKGTFAGIKDKAINAVKSIFSSKEDEQEGKESDIDKIGMLRHSEITDDEVPDQNNKGNNKSSGKDNVSQLRTAEISENSKETRSNQKNGVTPPTGKREERKRDAPSSLS